MEFPLNPHKKNQRSEGISQEKNGRDPLGGTDFFLDLFLNEVTKFWGLRENWLKKEFELAILQKKICIISGCTIIGIDTMILYWEGI